MKIVLPNINDYNYTLPDTKIAKYPLPDRDKSKLLVYTNGELSQILFYNLEEVLEEKDLLVFNNTKVIKARLEFQKETGARIEIFCLEPLTPSDYYQNFQQKNEVIWKCLIGNKKKWKSGMLQLSIRVNKEILILQAECQESLDDSFAVKFTWNNPDISFGEIIEQAGNLPIPPYLNRKTEASDLERYQTVYSKIKGSVAAPTAGLHFTDNVFKALNKKGIISTELTLHVGAGTFKPVSEENVEQHTMHTEHFSVTKEFLTLLLNNLKHIVAVGTTSVRTLESLYYLGYQCWQNKNQQLNHLKVNQWEPYEKNTLDFSPEQAILSLLKYMEQYQIETLHASTQIMIVPGYKFKLVKKLITNFHQPKSTLLLLIAAFVGNDWKRIYEYALENKFRFLSYGDSSLLIP